MKHNVFPALVDGTTSHAPELQTPAYALPRRGHSKMYAKRLVVGAFMICWWRLDSCWLHTLTIGDGGVLHNDALEPHQQVLEWLDDLAEVALVSVFLVQ